MDITISNGKLAAVIRTKGAELISLKDDNGREYMWDGNPEFWGKHSPVLFPVIGTLKNNEYIHKGKSYTMSRHGFARDKEFDVSGKKDSSVSFILASDNDTLKVYPFDFTLQIEYLLTENSLDIKYTVSNNGNDTMPFSLGAHPAFALPGDFNNYSLNFDETELVSHMLKDDLISDDIKKLCAPAGILPLDYGLFKDDALIFKSFSPKKIEILENKKPILAISFKDFPHLGIWTKENAPFICIEPWHGYADSVHSTGIFIMKEGIVHLGARCSANYTFNIQTLN